MPKVELLSLIPLLLQLPFLKLLPTMILLLLHLLLPAPNAAPPAAANFWEVNLDDQLKEGLLAPGAASIGHLAADNVWRFRLRSFICQFTIPPLHYYTQTHVLISRKDLTLLVSNTTSTNYNCDIFSIKTSGGV